MNTEDRNKIVEWITQGTPVSANEAFDAAGAHIIEAVQAMLEGAGKFTTGEIEFVVQKMLSAEFAARLDSKT